MEIYQQIQEERETISEDINIVSWKTHFMELLRGTDRRAVLKMREEEVDNGEGGQKITREEFIEQLRNLKKGKAPG